MYSLQKSQLLYFQKQEESGEEVGVQEILQVVQEGDSPQGGPDDRVVNLWYNLK